MLLEARTREAQNAPRAAAKRSRPHRLKRHDSRRGISPAKAQAATGAGGTADMQRQLAELQAKQTERGMVLTLGDVLFDTAQPR